MPENSAVMPTRGTDSGTVDGLCAFADLIKSVVALPLSDAEKAEAIRRLLAAANFDRLQYPHGIDLSINADVVQSFDENDVQVANLLYGQPVSPVAFIVNDAATNDVTNARISFGGGLCRHPDPPLARWQDAQAVELAERVAKFTERHGPPRPQQMDDLIALTTKPARPYRNRYAGLRREIARNNGWHPIRDKQLILQQLDAVLLSDKHIKKINPKIRYLSIEITEKGVVGYVQTIGPLM